MKLIKNKRAQDMKSKISSASPFGKRAQEEMVGFALIIIIVAVIFIVLLSFYLRGSQEKRSESPEANSFLQAILQYTTNCEENSDNITLQKLVYKCDKEELCDNGKKSCDILKENVQDILKASFGEINEGNVQNSVTKGYSFVILKTLSGRETEILNVTRGVVTNNYKGADQALPPSRGNWDNAIIIFDIYS